MKVEKREIRIHNVVASAAFKHGIDLDAIVKAFPHVEYRPERFLGLPFRLKKPKTCTLIFNSGRMVCTGAKSEREARRAILKVAKELKAAGIIITGKPEVHIVNIVASAGLGTPVDLEELCKRAHTGWLIYEPEQFPAAIYRMGTSKGGFPNILHWQDRVRGPFFRISPISTAHFPLEDSTLCSSLATFLISRINSLVSLKISLGFSGFLISL